MRKNHKNRKKKKSKAQKKRILRKAQKRNHVQYQNHKRTYYHKRRYEKPKENKWLNKGIIYFLFGIISVSLAIVIYFMSNKMPEEKVQPMPFVLLACNEPDQEMEIFSETDQDGMTEISLRWEKDSEYSPEKFSEVTFWILLYDQFEFSWSCEGDITAMDFIDNGGVNDVATPLYEKSGKGTCVLLELKCCRDQTDYVDVIRIQNDETAFKYVENDMCKLRVPCISPWFSKTGVFKDYIKDNSLDFSKKYNNDLTFEDPGFINRTINKEALYQPLIEYKASIADQSYFDSNLELNKALENIISADPIRAGVFFYWSGAGYFVPEIEYTVLDYDSKMTYVVNWCFALLGIGLSLFWEAVKGRINLVKIIRRDAKSKH